MVHDIVDFYNKTIFEKHKDGTYLKIFLPFYESLILFWLLDCEADISKINQKHCNAALENTCVLSLQNVNLHSPGEKDFLDVGGLEDVKDVLVESLLWPAKVNKFQKI